MRGHKTIVTPELEEQVIRCYVKKGMALTTIAYLGICQQRIASEILKRHGVVMKRDVIKFGEKHRVATDGSRGKIDKDSPPH